MLNVLNTHPFRDSADIEKRYGTRNLETYKNICVAALVLFFALWVAGLGKFWLGLALVMLGIGSLFDLAWRFAVYFQDKNIALLPDEEKELPKLDIANNWPDYIDFASYVFLYDIDDPKNKQEVVRGMLGSDFG